MQREQHLDIALKRVYADYVSDDGFRVLVERLWPRGISKDRARIDLWLKDVAPSPDLRTWFGHDPKRWRQFKRKYFAELDSRAELVELLRKRAREGKVTFVFSSKEERYNNAVALREYFDATRPARRGV